MDPEKRLDLLIDKMNKEKARKKEELKKKRQLAKLVKSSSKLF